MTVQFDMREFHQAVRQHLAETSRELSQAINARMFYWFLRVYALVPPKDPQAARNRIRAYMTEQIAERGRLVTKMVKRVIRGENATDTLLHGTYNESVTYFKRHGRSRQLRRVHLIAQAKRKERGEVGAYGQHMRDEAASLLRRAIGSVGYLKSPVVKALKKLNGHFTQFGFRTKKAGGREVSPNGALVKIASEYGLAMSNVGMHRGAKADTRPATPGLSPVATVFLSVGIDDGQVGRVNGIYNQAMQRSAADETRELRAHLAARMQALADKVNAR